MQKLTIFSFLVFAFLSYFHCKPKIDLTELSLIPQPTHIVKKNGAFAFSSQTKILVTSDNSQAFWVGNYFAAQINKAAGFSLPVEKAAASGLSTNSLILSLAEDSSLGAEGYSLIADANFVIIKAQQPAGLFYGVQTLRQLLPIEIESESPRPNINWEIPYVDITDVPRFSWRGAHLDVCRHFFPKEFVKKYIDILAMHKLNTFHWHLTEDQGWRVEIKKYPKLTEVGAWRVDREGIHWNEREQQKSGEKATYGGFYTQDEIKEIVAYAQSRFITVVPEIEMPGHAVAALAAYPENSCFGGPFTVIPGGYWPIKDIYCAGKESTFEFLEGVLDEVVPLFPGEFFHIGGDEAFKENWQKCPDCQRRIKEEGLKNEHELQSYFVKRIEKYLNSKGKRLIGWDEILEGGLAPKATVMSWRGFDGGIEAANAGHDVVMTPTSHCYFDYYQALQGEPLGIGGFLPLEKVYSFEPVPPNIDPEKEHHILGGQANVWTEYITTPEHAEYMLLPRLCALAEVVWSPKNSRDFNSFQNRMIKHCDRLAAAGINFRLPTPEGEIGDVAIFAPTTIQLKNPSAFTEIRFTIDGSEPTAQSQLYSEPIEVDKNMVIKARTFMPNGTKSPLITSNIYLLDKEKNGMVYKYYEGNWERLLNFEMLPPLTQGRCYTFDLAKVRKRNENYGLVLKGFLKIEKAGDYTFYTQSNDGSQLKINGQVVVDNDGLHTTKEASGNISLIKGLHEFEVDYFQAGGSDSLSVLYQGPGMEKQPLSPNTIFIAK